MDVDFELDERRASRKGAKDAKGIGRIGLDRAGWGLVELTTKSTKRKTQIANLEISEPGFYFPT